jgi:hypothetical protein
MVTNSLKFRGAPIGLTIFAYIMGIVGVGFPLLTFFVMFNNIGKLVIFLLFVLIFRYVIKKSIISVIFENDTITLSKPFCKIVLFYEDVKIIRENLEGFIPLTLIIVTMKNKDKFYFYCPKNERLNLDNFFKSKGLKIRPQA